MNDLSGLDWSSTVQMPQPKPQQRMPPSTASLPPIRHPSPILSRPSGTPLLSTRASDLSAKSNRSDSFTNLIASSTTKSATANMSLQERQKRLVAEKARQKTEQDEAYHSQDGKIWDQLGSGHGTPVVRSETSTFDDEDILAAFQASAPVDKSSHFPPPLSSHASSTVASRDVSVPRRIAVAPTASNGVHSNANGSVDDDDDPFGLGRMQQQKVVVPGAESMEDADNDILGMLGKPVLQVSSADNRQAQQAEKRPQRNVNDEQARDKAIAELMDMGFPIERCQDALGHTSNGLNVQEAVSFLLNQAHAQSNSRTRTVHPMDERRGRSARLTERIPVEPSHTHNAVPSWLRTQEALPRSESQSSASSDKDVTQYASEIGASLFKSAGSLWKTSQKKVQRVVADLQQDDPVAQPKWMRESQDSLSQKTSRRPDDSITAEAARLEGGREDQRRSATRAEARNVPPEQGRRRPLAMTTVDLPQRRPSPLNTAPSNAEQPTLGPSASAPMKSTRPPERLSRQAIDDQSAQAYISPARRKKVVEKPAESPAELDIFSDEAPALQVAGTQTPALQTGRPKPRANSRTISASVIRPQAQSRPIPTTSPAALASSTTHRLAGTAAFKRGDYASAQTSYTSALTALPSKHPLTIVLHCNRALTLLKTGDPKDAIADADAVISLIGPSHGDGETVDLGVGEDSKPLREYYGKALMRKAEALEHMEKWPDAASAWRVAVEAGIGGAVSIAGRNRADKAVATAAMANNDATPPRAASAPPRPAPVRKVVPAGRPAGAAANGLVAPTAEPAAVARLRAANAAAAAISDEAFALTDAVDARLAAWKAGKSDNVRALLASLDAVLWAEAGWSKVGMADLVMPTRVKIVYMKAIARVHPDKIAQTATTEQRMVSAAVFATLNEAWDKFRVDNKM